MPIKVEEAKKKLKAIPEGLADSIQSKIAARIMLAKQALMVKKLMHEGLLSPGHAEEFLDQIDIDTSKVEKSRSKSYR